MFGGLKMRAELAAKRVSRSIAGTILILIGIGFLTIAGWIKLSELYGALNASLVLGGAFVLMGCILLVLARAARVRTRPGPAMAAAVHGGATPSSDAAHRMPPLMEAFVVGLNAGAASSAARFRSS